MTFAAPWALAGLAFIALPVAIHLLGLGRARVRRFPSLRFLSETRPLPRRRRRLQDAGLLATRVAVLAVAAVALARPVGRVAPAAGAPTDRAVIVDTSASVSRVAAGQAADSLERAGATLVIRTARPADAIDGVAGWLATRSTRSELLLVSDFHAGAITARDLADVPSWVAIRAVRIPVADTSQVVNAQSVLADARVVARAEVRDGRTTVAWRREPGPRASASDAQSALTVAPSRALAHAAVARPVGVPAGPVSVPATPVTDSSDRAGVRMLAAPWQGNVVVRLVQDPLLRAAAASAPTVRPPATRRASAPAEVVARNDEGDPVAFAYADPAGGGALHLASTGAGASLLDAALSASAARAAVPSAPATERAPSTMSDSAVARMVRDARPDVPVREQPTDADAPSPARWIWGAVLALLVIEWVVRRSAGPHRVAGQVTDAG